MEAVLGVIALFMLTGAILGTILLVKAFRAVRRHAERTSSQARRLVEETSLKARRVQPGPAGELAALRLELRSSMTSTRQALESGVPADPSLKEALGLLDRLSSHAHSLDDELRLLEREPDRSRIAARLPGLRERAGRVTHSADSLRWAAQDRARQFGEDELAALGRQIDVEAGALRHWVPADTDPELAQTSTASEIPPTSPRSRIPGPDRLRAARRARRRARD